jgi:hypothetical protein
MVKNTYLEMLARPEIVVPPPREGLAVVHAKKPSVAYYRSGPSPAIQPTDGGGSLALGPGPLATASLAIDVLHIPRQRVFNNLHRYGNTSAGSVPLALDEAMAEDRIHPKDLVVLSGFGAGLTWGTAVMKW